MNKRIIYYKDLNNDDFAGTNIEVKPLKNNYRYLNKNIILRIWDFIIYFLIAKPLVILITNVKYH